MHGCCRMRFDKPAVVLIVLIAASLSACGESTDASSSSTSALAASRTSPAMAHPRPSTGRDAAVLSTATRTGPASRQQSPSRAYAAARWRCRTPALASCSPSPRRAHATRPARDCIQSQTRAALPARASPARVRPDDAPRASPAHHRDRLGRMGKTPPLQQPAARAAAAHAAAVNDHDDERRSRAGRGCQLLGFRHPRRRPAVVQGSRRLTQQRRRRPRPRP
jgi:hypothetical protein